MDDAVLFEIEEGLDEVLENFQGVVLGDAVAMRDEKVEVAVAAVLGYEVDVVVGLVYAVKSENGLAADLLQDDYFVGEELLVDRILFDEAFVDYFDGHIEALRDMRAFVDAAELAFADFLLDVKLVVGNLLFVGPQGHEADAVIGVGG